MSTEQRKITLTREEDGWWVAREKTIGLTTQGATRDDALENLDEVIAAIEGDAGRAPSDEELRSAGIDPEDNRRAGSGDLPDALK
jgi:predicted RNase H-like HicB family nuclease